MRHIKIDIKSVNIRKKKKKKKAVVGPGPSDIRAIGPQSGGRPQFGPNSVIRTKFSYTFIYFPWFENLERNLCVCVCV